MGKESSFFFFFRNHLFNTWCRESRIVTCERVNLDPVLVPMYEINSKWIKDSNIRAKTVKLLEENTGVNLYDLGLGSAFLRYDTQSRSDQRKSR